MNLIILFFIIILYYYVITFYSVTYDIMDKPYNNGTTMITNIKDYKKLFEQKIKYIRQHKDILSSANKNIIQLMKDKIDTENFGVQEAIITTLNIPGGLIGYTPAIPYDDTSKKICFQLEQGNVGWYWLYGTFPKTKDCFLYQLTRVDLLPTNLREKLGYKVGETTVYAITLGIGNGKDYYYTNVYFEGIFTILDNIRFSIISKDGLLRFTHDYNKITINCNSIKLTNNKDKTEKSLFDFQCETTNNDIMFFNQLNGCEPCQFNNSYQSYTNLYTTMSYSNDKGIVKEVENGFGWMDHEWGGALAPSILYKSVLTILGKGKLFTGLPPYIWLNIRLSDNQQYMIFSFPTLPIKKGDMIEANINSYQPSSITFFSNQPKVNVKVIDIVIYENTSYPSIYEVEIEGNKYILNTTPYGHTIFKDFSNTWHWGGSCDVLLNNKIVGTGFLEAQRLYGDIECLKDNFELLGFNDSGSFASTYYNTTNKTQLFISISIFIVLFILLLLFFYNFIKQIVNFIKESQSN